MEKNYFEKCKNFEEVVKLHKKLAKELHPDLGGNSEEFAKMQNQFETLKKANDDLKNASIVLQSCTISADKANKAIGKVMRTYSYAFNCLFRAFKFTTDELHEVVTENYNGLFKFFGIDTTKRFSISECCFIDFGSKKGAEIAYLINVRPIIERIIDKAIKANEDNEEFIVPDYNSTLSAYLDGQTYHICTKNSDGVPEWIYKRAPKSIKGIVLSICAKNFAKWMEWEKACCINAYAQKRAKQDISLFPDLSLNQFVDSWRTKIQSESMKWNGKQFVFESDLDSIYL